MTDSITARFERLRALAGKQARRRMRALAKALTKAPQPVVAPPAPIAVPTMAACEECSVFYLVRQGHQVYCSRQCKKRAQKRRRRHRLGVAGVAVPLIKHCQVCKLPFRPEQCRQIYCSSKCGRKGMKSARRAKILAVRALLPPRQQLYRRPRTTACLWCDGPIPSWRTQLCSAECARKKRLEAKYTRRRNETVLLETFRCLTATEEVT